MKNIIPFFGVGVSISVEDSVADLKFLLTGT